MFWQAKARGINFQSVPVRWTLGRTSGACASLWLYRRALEQVLLVIEPVKGPQSAGARSETCRTIAAPEAQKSSIGEYEDTDVMWAIDQRPAMRAADAAGRRWLNSCLDLSHSSGKKRLSVFPGRTLAANSGSRLSLNKARTFTRVTWPSAASACAFLRMLRRRRHSSVMCCLGEKFDRSINSTDVASITAVTWHSVV